MKAHWLEHEHQITEQELGQNGVYYAKLGCGERDYQQALDQLKQQRGYVEQDIVALGPETPNLEAICAKFIDEHHHDDDEVRFVLEGQGIFDIRSRDDRWMRVTVEPGDLIVVPKERHHRFMLTDTRAIRCVRLFKDTNGWIPHYRQ